MHKYILSSALIFLGCVGTPKMELQQNPSPVQTDSLKAETAKACDINAYKTVDIDGQVWLAENWNCDSAPSKCYDNDPANCQKYGRLYTWETAIKVCPAGWHLPSDADWNALMKFVNTATKLKDTSGFAALPGGSYSWSYPASFPNNPEKPSGSFYGVGNDGVWWSSCDLPALRNSGQFPRFINCNWRMAYNYENIFYSHTSSPEPVGGGGSVQWYSVRCVKDK